MNNPIKDWYFKYKISQCHRQYDEELRILSDPYGAWIRKNEEGKDAGRIGKTDSKRFRVLSLHAFLDKMASPHELGEGWIAVNLIPGRISEPSEKWIEYFSESSSHTPTALFYGDEDVEDIESHRRSGAWFKPDDSPETLLSFFYYGSLIFIKGSLVTDALASYAPCFSAQEIKELERKDRAKAERLRIYDFILFYIEFCYASGYKVRRIPEVLFHAECVGVFLEDPEGNEYVNPDAYWGYEAEYNACKISAIRRRGNGAYIRGIPHAGKIYCVPVYELPLNNKPMVSVIIPSKDHPDLILRRVDEIRNKMNYPNVEIIVVDNGSSDENKRILYDAQVEAHFMYIYEKMEFNFSAMCNMGAEHSRGDYLLFLNDDVELVQKDFISTLVGQAMAPGIGCVGAKLLYPQERRIQHIGISEMAVGPAHKLIGAIDSDSDYYYGRNVLNYNVIGVTAACMLISADLFFDIGGFCEDIAVSYNDVDLCYTVYESGYRNVVRNDAVAFHHEGLSRGDDRKSAKKWERLLYEKGLLYKRHPYIKDNDPYYSPNLAGYKPRFLCSQLFKFEDRFEVSEPVVFEEKIRDEWYNNCLTITLEHCREQQKLSNDEEDMYLIEGWAYVLGMDSSRYEKSMILTIDDGESYEVEIFTRNREDVAKILPDEERVTLSGFVARIKRSALRRGEYTIGLLFKDRCSRQRLYKECEKTLYVD